MLFLISIINNMIIMLYYCIVDNNKELITNDNVLCYVVLFVRIDMQTLFSPLINISDIHI